MCKIANYIVAARWRRKDDFSVIGQSCVNERLRVCKYLSSFCTIVCQTVANMGRLFLFAQIGLVSLVYLSLEHPFLWYTVKLTKRTGVL